MKKIIIMMLVAIVPLLTIAQKRIKKDKKTKTEKVAKSNATYEFMVITGYEIMIDEGKRIKAQGPDQIPSADMQLRMMMKSNGKVMIRFDFGSSRTKGNLDLLRLAETYRSMAAAVNGAANNGWEFVSSDVIASGATKIYYYYMRKNK